MAEGAGFLAQIGERLGLRSAAPSERDLMVGQLGTREGRESLMQEAARPPAAPVTPERQQVLQNLMTFQGRNELFLEARASAGRAGRPFEEFGDGELKRFNAMEAGRPVAARSGAESPASSERDQVLQSLATRDGRAAFLAEGRESGAGREGSERGALLERSQTLEGRSSLVAEAETDAQRKGRPFESVGFREGWARDGSVDLALDIGGAPNRSAAEVGAMIQGIDRSLARETPQAETAQRRSAGLER